MELWILMTVLNLQLKTQPAILQLWKEINHGLGQLEYGVRIKQAFILVQQTKKIPKQLKANPKIEVCFLNNEFSRNEDVANCWVD